jgi:hypothetical protein
MVEVTESNPAKCPVLVGGPPLVVTGAHTDAPPIPLALASSPALKSGGAFSNSPALLVFDFRTQHWRTLAERQINEPVWSQDEQYIYFDVVRGRPDDAIWRVRISDGNIERIVGIGDYPRAASDSFGMWFGLAPDGSPLLLREDRQTEIYALDVQW